MQKTVQWGDFVFTALAGQHDNEKNKIYQEYKLVIYLAIRQSGVKFRDQSCKKFTIGWVWSRFEVTRPAESQSWSRILL